MSVSMFDMLGPITVGPSSSHTAGAVRIGLACRTILKEDVKKADITFYGSFASTYKGHGTDKAVVGGLLGFGTDDVRVRDSLELAGEMGLAYTISTGENPRYHPNTVVIDASSEHNHVRIRAESVGGGAIRLSEINGFEVSVQCRADTLIVFGRDVIGTFYSIAKVMNDCGYNIGTLYLDRERRAGDTVIVIETDVSVDPDTVGKLQALDNVIGVVAIEKF
ncbi:MAG: L-serine ammonia-lyase, iron-sulfur-dependent, subunit beta [Ruminococcaceae bacterium]|nr:L-serine ammonia-lyase, iron-sulfur-dependent, subunit beta [Oscillospiraceae bacterium]